jgi:hypothetical protein
MPELQAFACNITFNPGMLHLKEIRAAYVATAPDYQMNLQN